MFPADGPDNTTHSPQSDVKRSRACDGVDGGRCMGRQAVRAARPCVQPVCAVQELRAVPQFAVRREKKEKLCFLCVSQLENT
jgi:hypothetical protein